MQCAILYETTKSTCNPEFHGVLYKINPHNLSCMYKKMFETCATNSLRRISGDWIPDEDTIVAYQSGVDQFWAVPVRDKAEEGVNAENKLLSKTADTAVNWPFEMLTGCNTRPYGNTNVEGWMTCDQAHLRDFGGYRRPNEYTEIFSKGRSQSASGSSNNIELDVTKMKLDQKNRQNRSNSVMSRCSSNKSADIASRDTQSEGPGIYCGGSSTNCLNQIKYQFLHDLHPKDYTAKYREEYTYRRQRMLRPNNYDYRTYFPVLTVSSLRCYRNCNAMAAHAQSPTLRPPTRHQFVRKKSPTRQRKMPEAKVYHMSGSQSSSSSPIETFVKPIPDHRNLSTSTLVTRNCMLGMGFQGPCSQNYRASEFAIQNISPFVCRSRPTIPSNAHGNIHSTSGEISTHSITLGVKRSGEI